MVSSQEDRYSRQARFSKIGPEGQEKLRKSSVVIVGCGALGSGVAQNLGRAGVGRLRIVDRDFLEMSNLARQVLFEEEDAVRHLPKAVAAANRLRRINSEIEVEPIVADVTPRNILSLIEGADVIADGSDNMDLRFLLNDACVKRGIPWVYGGAVASEGMTMTIRPGEGPCLRCVLEELPEPMALQTCNEVGVLNTLTGLVSAIQSNEVLKLLVGSGPPNPGLLRFDVWTLNFQTSALSRRADCPACGVRKFEYLEAHGTRPTARMRGRQSACWRISPKKPPSLDLQHLARSLRSSGEVEYNGFLLVLKLKDCELVVFADGRVIVKGIQDEQLARRIVAQRIPAIADCE